MEHFDISRSVDEDESFVYVGPIGFSDDGEPYYLKYDKESPTWIAISEFDKKCRVCGQPPLSLYHKTQAFIWFLKELKLTSIVLH